MTRVYRAGLIVLGLLSLVELTGPLTRIVWLLVGSGSGYANVRVTTKPFMSRWKAASDAKPVFEK